MCIDCFSTRSNLKLRDSALCQEISQTFLYVNVMFTIFISKKHDSEGKAWLIPELCYISLSPWPTGRGEKSTPISSLETPPCISLSNQFQVLVWKVESPTDAYLGQELEFQNGSPSKKSQEKKKTKQNPDI